LTGAWRRDAQRAARARFTEESLNRTTATPTIRTRKLSAEVLGIQVCPPFQLVSTLGVRVLLLRRVITGQEERHWVAVRLEDQRHQA